MPHKKRGHGHHKHTKEEKEVGVVFFFFHSLTARKARSQCPGFSCRLLFFTHWFQFLRIIDQSIHQLFAQGRRTYSLCKDPSWTCVRVRVCALMGCVGWSGRCLINLCAQGRRRNAEGLKGTAATSLLSESLEDLQADLWWSLSDGASACVPVYARGVAQWVGTKKTLLHVLCGQESASVQGSQTFIPGLNAFCACCLSRSLMAYYAYWAHLVSTCAHF